MAVDGGTDGEGSHVLDIVFGNVFLKPGVNFGRVKVVWRDGVVGREDQVLVTTAGSRVGW